MTYTRFHNGPTWSVPSNGRGSWGNRFFVDTEFTDFEAPQLISLAIVGENGSEFYGECTDYDTARCSDFVRAAVLPQLGRFRERAMPFNQLRQALRAWIGGIPTGSKPVLCYDLVTDLSLVQFLFDGQLPEGWMLEDIRGQIDPRRQAEYFARHGGEHHALHDARANAYAYIG
ncbi:3'-5' exoribonuclease [Burkholderia sp. Se-20373]|uniref:3'-5' exoribonuclease n=1 Tax=Burkholderia sp. Se-20373 TaxID=2703898 RepID=UPI00197F3316|nr:3'-5' exoribonuclease [Burkholderia sp. Se-20373]MBN3748304.1 3'-5' exoribonuclease [Burkholderia sp. Se-20373]